MSVYKLELEKASIIIKKETIVYDIPDGTTFGYSDFSDPEALKKVIPYVNNGNYGSYLFYGCKFPLIIDESNEFKIANGLYTFNKVGNKDNPSNIININCERVTELKNCFTNFYIKQINLTNTDNVGVIYNIMSNSYDSLYGLDLKNCYDFQPSNAELIRNGIYFEILNFGMHKDLTYVDFHSVYTAHLTTRNSFKKALLENSFNRAEAGYEPCKVWLFSTPFTAEELAEVTSKGYTITT